MPASSTSTPEIIIIVIVALLIIFAIAMIARRAKTRQLRERFGPEYDRTVRTAGDRQKAEAELRERQKRHDELKLRELDPSARERYRDRWRTIQMKFVDDPSAAVREADALLIEVMRERGYPADEFDRRSADVSVDYPNLVNNYRKAHTISDANANNTATTEDLRQATVYYRSLFDELLGSQQRLKETG